MSLLKIVWILVIAHVLLTWYLSVRRGLRARQREILPAKDATEFQPPVSILVPAWKEKGTIERCIEALKKVDYPVWEALILAGGPDGTYDAAIQASTGDNHFRVLVRGPEPKNVAITQGVQSARHDIFVLLDADSVVFPDWLSYLVKPLASGLAASSGMHYPLKETWISLEERMQIIHAYQIHGINSAQGCSSQAIRRETFNQIGPLPSNAYAWEDWDIGVRLMEAGETNAFASGAKLLTDRPTSFREFWKDTVRCYRSHLAGLWYHRKVMVRRPVWAFFEIFFYLISIGLSLALSLGLVLWIVRPDFLPWILPIAALAVVWIGGRRFGLAAEVAVFTDDSTWLWRGWSLVVLLPVQFAAAIVALLGVWKQPQFDYKGRREPDSSGV